MSLGTLVFVGALVAGGTGAFFSDTETSEGNIFTAGSVTLQINDITHTYNGIDQNNAPIFTDDGFSFDLSDLKPLDTGEITFELLNGENEAFICAMVEETGNADNTVVDPELDLGDDDTEGELGDFLSFSFNGQTGSLAEASGQWASLGTLAANGTGGNTFGYCFGDYDGSTCVLSEEDDNLAQTDSLTADIEFYAVQTRNNPDFSCDDLNEEDVWYETSQNGASLSFVEDDTNGTVLQLITSDDVQSRVRWQNDTLDVDLDTLTTISFDSKQVVASNPAVSNASMRLFIDLDGDGIGPTQEIIYEPYYNIFAHNALGVPSMVLGVWQTWSATLAEGKFWANGGFLGATPSGGAYATNFTLQDVVDAHPDAKIVGISLGMGTYNVSQTILVDDLVINGSTIDLQN